MRHAGGALLVEALAAAAVAAASDCIYRPAGANGHYDLTPLRRTSANYRVDDPERSGVYLLNFCGPLVDDVDFKKYSCPPSAAACLGQDGGSEVGKSLGVASASNIKQLAFILKYTFYDGDSCATDRGARMKTLVLLQCEDNGPDEGPTFLRTENCEHVFRMKTAAACLKGDTLGSDNPPPAVSCKIQNAAGNVYDLSPLVRAKTDWFVTTPESEYQWYLNICRDVNDVSTEKCRLGSSACLTKRTDPTYWRSIGRTKQTKLEHDSQKGLTLTMEGGELCADQTQSKVVIDFICDANSLEVGKPIYTDDNPEDCVHQFTWRTHYACPARSTPATTCELRDDTTKVNLEPLRKIRQGENWIVAHKGHAYFLNVCGSLQPSRMTSGCAPGSVACRVKESETGLEGISLGASQRLTNENGALQLVVEGGDFCGDSLRRKATIRMLCNPNAGRGSPIVLEDSGCVTRMEWETAYACSRAGLSGGAAFWLTVFLLTAVYFIGGTLYKRFRLGRRGAEQIPNVDTWRNLYKKTVGRRGHEYNIVL